MIQTQKYTRRMKAGKSELPDYDFPRHGNYRCICCDSRSGPFYDDRTGKKGLDFLCHECHNEVVEVRQVWMINDELSRTEDSLKEDGDE